MKDLDINLAQEETSRCEANGKTPQEELEGTVSTYEDYLNATDKFRAPLGTTQTSHNSTLKPPCHQRRGSKLMELSQYLLTEPTEHSQLVIEDEDNGHISLKWCAFCRRESIALTKYKNSAKTFWASLAILLSGGFLGCFLIPYAVSDCKQSVLMCSKCNHIIS